MLSFYRLTTTSRATSTTVTLTSLRPVWLTIQTFPSRFVFAWAAVGDIATYEVRIENRGTKAAEMVQVIGYFSEGIEPLAIKGHRGEVATGQVVMDPIASIEASQELIFQITAKANRPGNHVFRAELQCSQPETRLASEEWTKYYVGGGELRQATIPVEQAFQIEAQ